MANTKSASLKNWFRSKLLGRPPVDETGEQNARRFVEAVVRLAHDERVILCYPHQGLRASGRGDIRFGWVWMLNPLWRARVAELLKDAPVRDVIFSEPDTMDGWTFSAHTTVPVPRVAQLALDEVL
ncbi:hypothetical protein CPT_Sonora_060 [Stenotrophomonas phage Sonora]|nr:hypothetical protein CPT_Sonora_060 [Stenotrophomonas phage Sonora]